MAFDNRNGILVRYDDRFTSATLEPTIRIRESESLVSLPTDVYRRDTLTLIASGIPVIFGIMKRVLYYLDIRSLRFSGKNLYCPAKC